MKPTIPARSEAGFSMVEMLVAILILLPIMAAAMSLFSTAVSQHGSEQNSIEVNQDARAALEIMTREIAQAGSHRDRIRNTSGAAGPSTTATATVSIPMASTSGFIVGDWVIIDPNNWEETEIQGVSSNSISAVLGKHHNSGVSVQLKAYPFSVGVIPPAGMGANASQNVSTLKFFGDINGDLNSAATDPNLYYIEYGYDSANHQITRSATEITASAKSNAIPFISNVTSAQFTVNTNELGVITVVNITMTVRSNWRTGSKYEAATLASRVFVPSASAATALMYELKDGYQEINKMPLLPDGVAAWAGVGGS
jgi:type II secretory pathway pseudopilin PulG